MKSARDYIVFPLDVASYEEAEKYVALLREYVGVFKVGLELFIRTGPQLIKLIKRESSAKIFLDLKLHDIPATVGRAMASIAALGVDFATVHCGENQEMLKAAVQSAGKKVAVLGVTVLTSVTNEHIESAGYKDVYVKDIRQLVLNRAKMAKSCGLAGVICSGLEVGEIKNRLGDDFLCMTPGIRPDWPDKEAGDQRRVTTPSEAIKKGADYLVIGRPIRDAGDPVAASLRIAEEIDTQLSK